MQPRVVSRPSQPHKGTTSVPPSCWFPEKPFLEAGKQHSLPGATLLPPNTWYRSSEGTAWDKADQRAGCNLGQVSLPPHASASLLPPQKPLMVGLFLAMSVQHLPLQGSHQVVPCREGLDQVLRSDGYGHSNLIQEPQDQQHHREQRG